MIEIGYKLSSEEFGPADLVRFAARAEQAGFGFALISDHFHPWSDRQGESPFVWTVVGAVGQATSRLRLGTAVTCPTIRTHPAIIAQAGFALAVNGDASGASALLDTLRALAGKDVNVSMYVAMVEAGLGHEDEALAALEAQARSPDSIVLQGIQHWYAFRGLRADPRFRSLLSQAW